MYISNLYPYRTKNPKNLIYENDETNNKILLSLNNICDLTVCAWGNNIGPPSQWLINNIGPLYYLELSKNKTPKHPLFLNKNLELKIYN